MAQPDTFGGVSFSLLIEGHQQGAGSLVSVEAVPGSTSGVFIVDLGGPLPETLECDAKFVSESAYASLFALRGTQGTLAFQGTTRTAVLESVGRTRWLPGGRRIARTKWWLL